MIGVAPWTRFLTVFFHVNFFIIFWVGVLGPFFPIWGPKWPPRAPKIDVFGAKMLPKSTPEPKIRVFVILWKYCYLLGASLILRVGPFQKSIKIDPAPLQVVVRGSKSAWEQLLPAFFDFHRFLMDFGVPWGTQKSLIFRENERGDLAFCILVVNLGCLGALL